MYVFERSAKDKILPKLFVIKTNGHYNKNDDIQKRLRHYISIYN